MISRLTFIFGLLTLFASSTVAQETNTSSLAFQAKYEHEVGMFTQYEQLNKSIDKLILETLIKDDTTKAKLIALEKSNFLSDAKYPTIKELQTECDAYINNRKKLASSYFQKMSTIISKIDINDSPETKKKLEKDLAAFIGTEKKYLENVAAKQPVKEQNKSTEPEPVKLASTKEQYVKFCEEYRKVMDDANSQVTTAKSEKVYRDGIVRLKALLAKQTWEFNCTITNIEGSGGKYNIYFNEPEEVEESDTFSPNQSDYVMGLSEKEAINIKPGDVIVFTGVVGFAVREDRVDHKQKFLTTRFEGKWDRYETHWIYFQSLKATLKK